MSTTLMTAIAGGATLTGVYAYVIHLIRKPAPATSVEG